MANLPESATYEPGVYQLEEADQVLAGAGGIANLQAKQLANRTEWLNANKAALGHTHDFAEIASTPTTLAGYGITDAYTAAQVDAALAAQDEIRELADYGGGESEGDVLRWRGVTGMWTPELPPWARESELDAHTGDLGNPHAVTAAQVGAPTDAQFNAHVTDAGNPHTVTAAQLGAVASVDGVSNPGGDIALVPGENVSISPNDAGNSIAFAVPSVPWGDVTGEPVYTQRWPQWNEISGGAADFIEFANIEFTGIPEREFVMGIDNSEGPAYWHNSAWRHFWTEWNHGAGSGLDADKLDGQHASAFADASHNHSAGDITSGTFARARLPSAVLYNDESAIVSSSWGFSVTPLLPGGSSHVFRVNNFSPSLPGDVLAGGLEVRVGFSTYMLKLWE